MADSTRFLAPLCVLSSILSLCSAQTTPERTFGHSSHGVAFDTGLRTKPWKMPGIGKTHFPITSKVPEVQEWFDQGNSLLHSFWYEEAERTFRWCVKLDPDCAMGYWGLAVTGFNWSNMGARYGKTHDRYREFLKQSVARKGKATPRERMFIEAWDAAYAEKANTGKVLSEKLKEIVKAFPEDIEAKAYAGLYSIGSDSAADNDKLLQEVLRGNPDHPGAHHYRIHNWDFADPMKGLDSCKRYGEVAPAIGHAMHMPGHIFSKVGMWHEAALAMDGATRVELNYMNARMALPFEAWNFAHNRNYLSYIQEQLGMADAAIQGARDLLAAPMDPEYNNYESFDTGKEALVRALVKFERWNEILKPWSIPWRKGAQDDRSRAEVEGIALASLGKVEEAKRRLAALANKKIGEDPPESEYASLKSGSQKSLAARILIAEGKAEAGLAILKELADKEIERFKGGPYALGDPPSDPDFDCRTYANALIRNGRLPDSIPYYEAVLKHVPNDGFSLAGLAIAHAKSFSSSKAAVYVGRLASVWDGADREGPWMKEVAALGIQARPLSETPFAERPYRPQSLNRLGPSNWEPYKAPNLTVQDMNGKTVRLSDYKGRNVVLVFYLSDECVHCVEQLFSINGKTADFGKLGSVVLAVSSATPQHNKESAKLGGLGFTLLSDKNHEGARRFASYDDFENMELHSTILIDREGYVRWKRTGGDPFKNVEWLLKEVERFSNP